MSQFTQYRVLVQVEIRGLDFQGYFTLGGQGRGSMKKVRFLVLRVLSGRHTGDNSLHVQQVFSPLGKLVLVPARSFSHNPESLKGTQ